MKRKSLSFILALLLCFSLIMPKQAVLAGRGWNYVSYDSPDGKIYPDIEATKTRQIQRLFNRSGLYADMNHTSNPRNSNRIVFPEDFAIPAWDSIMSADLVKQIQAIIQEAYNSKTTDNWLAGLSKVANALQPGEIWIDAFFKLHVAHEWWDGNPYSNYDDYFFTTLYLPREADNIKSSLVSQYGSNYDEIGKALAEACSLSDFFNFSTVADYRIDLNNFTGNTITITGQTETDGDEGSGGKNLGTINAYDEKGSEILSTKVVDIGDPSYYGKKYTYAIPVKTGENIVRFKSDIGETGLTIVVNGSKLPGAAQITVKQPAGINTLLAKPTASTVLVNGKNVAFDAYNIDGNNYFKLRDLACILSGTSKQFEVTWDGEKNAINLLGGKVYTVIGGEMEGKGTGEKKATPTTSKIYLDGKEVQLTAYNIGGNNYFRLRDVGQTFDFNVGWDGASNTVTINTNKGYSS